MTKKSTYPQDLRFIADNMHLSYNADRREENEKTLREIARYIEGLEAEVRSMDETVQFERRDAWLQAWIAVGRAEGCRDPKAATVWADRCLKDYDERFHQNMSQKG